MENKLNEMFEKITLLKTAISKQKAIISYFEELLESEKYKLEDSRRRFSKFYDSAEYATLDIYIKEKQNKIKDLEKDNRSLQVRKQNPKRKAAALILDSSLISFSIAAILAILTIPIPVVLIVATLISLVILSQYKQVYKQMEASADEAISQNSQKINELEAIIRRLMNAKELYGRIIAEQTIKDDNLVFSFSAEVKKAKTAKSKLQDALADFIYDAIQVINANPELRGTTSARKIISLEEVKKAQAISQEKDRTLVK